MPFSPHAFQSDPKSGVPFGKRLQKTMEKDPPCYQWENSRTFYGHDFNSFLYVDPRPGNQKTSPVRLGDCQSVPSMWPIQGQSGESVEGFFWDHQAMYCCLVVEPPSWKINMKVNGKDDIPYMKWKNMFETTSQTVTWGLLFRDFLLWICGRTFCGVRNRVRFDNWVGLRDWLLKKNMFPYMIFP